MANEATVVSSLQIVGSGNLQYRSFPTSFQADVAGNEGPETGFVVATVTGTVVTFVNLVTPALCHIRNLDSTNYVDYGIYDPDTNKFYPIGEILPGEGYIVRLSRNMEEEFGTGTSDTGTTGTDANRLMVRGNAASVNTVIEAFEA